MNSKIIHVASITFALIFVALFLLLWARSSHILGMSVQEMNSLYSTDYAIDLSLFDGTVVTEATTKNLEKEIENLKHIYAGLEVDIIGAGEVYDASLIENENGIVTKIEFKGR